MNATEQQRIASAKQELRRIQAAVDAASNDWERHISAARAVITSVDSTRLMEQQNRAQDQIFIISALQKIAYHDADSGGVQDIADWCVTQWLAILQYDPESVEALKGTHCGWSKLLRLP